jgi:hypothetical protein
MKSDAEVLVQSLEDAMPRMEKEWCRCYRRGYEARLAGRERYVRARGGRKGMWLRGWDGADVKENNVEKSESSTDD